jgi:hypothetical protein
MRVLKLSLGLASYLPSFFFACFVTGMLLGLCAADRSLLQDDTQLEFTVAECVESEEIRQITPKPIATTGAVRALADVEKEYILAALEQNSGNQTQTAAQLHIGSATLYRKLKSYGAIVKPRRQEGRLHSRDADGGVDNHAAWSARKRANAKAHRMIPGSSTRGTTSLGTGGDGGRLRRRATSSNSVASIPSRS